MHNLNNDPNINTIPFPTFRLLLVVGSRSGIVGAGGSCVVTGVQRLVRVLISCIGCCDCRTSVGSVVRWAVVVSGRSESTGGRDGTGHFSIAETTLIATVAAKELYATAASIVVGRAGAVALVLLMLSVDTKLHEGGDEEENAGERSVYGSTGRRLLLV